MRNDMRLVEKIAFVTVLAAVACVGFAASETAANMHKTTRTPYKDQVARCNANHKHCLDHFSHVTYVVNKKHCDSEYAHCLKEAKQVHDGKEQSK
jgi:hypothetical protein